MAFLRRNLSPIQSLPVELLASIFLFATHGAVEADEERNPSFTSESTQVPLILSSVNRKWRTVAHRTSALWTSICVTSELIDDLDADPLKPSILNARHLDIYLKHSRNYPLDILIDGRDYDWDFSEPGISPGFGWGTYVPPFSSAHMKTAVGILLPHIARWRSLVILTDTWAPIHAALQRIQPIITTLGAPLLESLTLMRCNDFASYSPTFEPRGLQGPAFLTLADDAHSALDILPRLQNLTLRGVHVDWSGLASILSHSTHSGGLSHLELSSHSLDVRPTIPEFHQLLSKSPRLTKLVIDGSGPRSADENEETPPSGLDRISLPHLREVTLGYRSAYEGHILFQLFDAPKVRDLTLEDATHPGDPEDVDVSELLTYVATGEFPTEIDDDYAVVYALSDGLHYQLAVQKDSMRQSVCAPEGREDSDSGLRTAFPFLENVTLKGVICCPRTLRTFFGALPNLQRLDLSGMSMKHVRALLPEAKNDPDAPCPCPRLQSLCVRGFEKLQFQDFAFLIAGLAVERVGQGGSELHEVDIHIGDTAGGHVADSEDVIRVSQIGTLVKIIRGLPREDEVDGEMGFAHEVDGDPFKAGGTFNDPMFDARYGGSAFFEARG